MTLVETVVIGAIGQSITIIIHCVTTILFQLHRRCNGQCRLNASGVLRGGAIRVITINRPITVVVDTILTLYLFGIVKLYGYRDDGGLLVERFINISNPNGYIELGRRAGSFVPLPF
jgi:hypothetical protein